MKSELLQRIHHFYPIGLPFIYRDYPGFIELKEILSKKINEIVENKKTRHTDLLDALISQYSQFSVSDLGFWQFPNYCYTVDIESKISDGVETTTRIFIVVSLLIDYFTIYLEEEYKYLYFNSSKYDKVVHPSNSVLCFTKCYNEEYKSILNNLMIIATKYFPNHKYINHSLLFNMKISSGTILSNMENFFQSKEYCAYDFLFSIDKSSNDSLIVLD